MELERSGRSKSLYSIYKKMKSQNLPSSDIQDLTVFRILVNGISQWYMVLGLVHAKWKPVPGRFKDYIATPRENGYQILHTTVIGPDGFTGHYAQHEQPEVLAKEICSFVQTNVTLQ